MNTDNFKKHFHKNIIIISAVIILLISLFPVLAGAGTMQYDYDDTRQLTLAVYNDAAKVEYAYDGSGNRTSKTMTFTANISVSTPSLDFGSIDAGSTSPAQAITINNTGNANLVIDTITITGTNASEFAKQADTCSGSSVIPSGTCHIDIAFSPTSAGSRTAALSIPSNDPDSATMNVSLSGTGAATLTVTKSGTGAGTVTSSSVGINCGADCSETYSEAAAVTLTASADASSIFNGWSGCDSVFESTCTVTMTSAKTVNAIFTIKQYTITASAGDNGSISPAGAVTVSYGGSQTFTITPSTGYRVFDVFVDSAAAGAVTTYTFSNVSADHTISASFVTSTINASDHIGVYVNSEWYLDVNGNGLWDGEPIDKYGYFGLPNSTPVTGDWNGDGITEIGVYVDSSWYLDVNGNGLWDGEPIDKYGYFGLPNSTPVTGDWDGDGIAGLGIYDNGTWYLDMNGDTTWNGTPTDSSHNFGYVGAMPVTGKW